MPLYRTGRSSIFLSTPSARRATRASSNLLYAGTYFYPRPLRGGRRFRACPGCFSERFLSTPSARRATRGCGGLPLLCIFLSTPSARRATLSLRPRSSTSANFYPRPLRGGRLAVALRVGEQICISIHALCEEGDSMSWISISSTSYFYPRPLRGGRQQKQRQNLYFQTNYTTFCTNLEEP